jgi:hypothetical protein
MGNILRTLSTLQQQLKSTTTMLLAMSHTNITNKHSSHEPPGAADSTMG